MDAKRIARWQQGAGAILEPGEQVVAAAPGQKAEGMWLIMLLVDALALPLLQRARGYLVTDRTVYLCRLSSLRNYRVEEVLEKRPRKEARMEFRRNRVTLDGANPVYVGYLPIGKRWAREVVATVSGDSKGATPAGK